MKEATRQTKTSEGRILVLCDTEEEYAQLMTDFLKKQKNLPWELRTYTDVQELLRTELEKESLLVVAESAFTEDFLQLSPARLVVLNESGLMRWENISYVDKYQKAENVLRFLLEIYMEIADNPLPRL